MKEIKESVGNGSMDLANAFTALTKVKIEKRDAETDELIEVIETELDDGDD